MSERDVQSIAESLAVIADSFGQLGAVAESLAVIAETLQSLDAHIVELVDIDQTKL